MRDNEFSTRQLSSRNLEVTKEKLSDGLVHSILAWLPTSASCWALSLALAEGLLCGVHSGFWTGSKPYSTPFPAACHVRSPVLIRVAKSLALASGWSSALHRLLQDESWPSIMASVKSVLHWWNIVFHTQNHWVGTDLQDHRVQPNLYLQYLILRYITYRWANFNCLKPLHVQTFQSTHKKKKEKKEIMLLISVIWEFGVQVDSVL